MTPDIRLGEVLDGTSVLACGLDTARAVLTTADAFVTHQSVFDRQARLRVPERVRKIDRAAYLAFVETQVRSWSDAEIGALKRIVASIAAKFSGLAIALPETVYIVKTTGAEEGEAAYTRRLDTIVMPETKVSGGPGAGADALHPLPNATEVENTIIHEFFHLISKNNPEVRRALYRLVSYTQFDRPVALPDVDWRCGTRMTDLRITNPDTPVLDVAIPMVLPGAPDGRTTMLMPLLLASGPYEQGMFFDYLEWWFMGVHEAAPGQWKAMVGDDGRPVMANADAMMGQYMRLVGRNLTNEIFHPDEIMAQSFRLVMNEPNLGLLQKIASELTVARAS